MQGPLDGHYLAPNSEKKMIFPNSLLAAGEPLETYEDYEWLDINDLITNGRDGFIAYRITGDSMLEYIKPGYLVFVDPYSEPNEGDTVVSRINGKNCVKIFQRKSNGLYLVSANKAYDPVQITKADEFQILGVVRGHLALYGR